MGQGTPAGVRAGVLFGLVAYLGWGGIPLYFYQLKGVPAGEILAHRVVWSMLALVAVGAAVGNRREVWAAVTGRRAAAAMAASSGLLGANWLLYIYATVTDRVAEASLGYFLLPLANAALATAVLGERLRPAHYPALGLVAVGVAVPAAAAGTFSWLAVAIPVTFALYGLVRKTAPVDSLAGLTVEAAVLTPPSVGYLAYRHLTAADPAFGPSWRLNALLVASGVVTIVPLLTFTLSVRRLPLLANSFIQFVSPTMQLVIAVGLFGEPMTGWKWFSMGCVWAAVAVFLADAVAGRYGRRAEA